MVGSHHNRANTSRPAPAARLLPLLLAVAIWAPLGSCGTLGSGAIAPSTLALQPAGDVVAQDSNFTLRTVDSGAAYGAPAGYELQVTPGVAGTDVDVMASSPDLRQVLLTLAYDPVRMHPVSGSSQTWPLPSGVKQVSLVVLDQPGTVHMGTVISQPQSNSGASGRYAVAHLRFVAGPFEPRRVSGTMGDLDGRVSDLTVDEGTGEINFSYVSQGDYDQNTEVNISDLSPLGARLGESSGGGPFDFTTVQSVVDGDSNGEINISDITPIGASFGRLITAWTAYQGAAADYPTDAGDDNGAATLIDNIDKTHLEVGGVPIVDRRTVTFTTANIPFTGEEIWVRPVWAEEGEGIASNGVLLGAAGDTTPPVWTDSGNPGALFVAPHDGTATVYWGEATDALSAPVKYTVYYSQGATVDFGTAQTIQVPASVPFDTFEQIDVPGLTNGTEYAFAVRAKDSATVPNEEQNAVELTATPDQAVEVPTAISTDTEFTTPMIVSNGNTSAVTNGGCLTFDHDLTINGTLMAQDGDLCIEVFGDLFVNGTITLDGPDADVPDGTEWNNIKIICHGNYLFSNTSVVNGEANVWIVDDPAAITTTQDVIDDTDTDANPGAHPVNLMPEDQSGTSRVRSSAPPSTPVAPRNSKALPPISLRGFVSGDWGVVPTPPVGVKRIILNVQAKNGRITFQDWTITGPKGRKGKADSACIANGGKGEDAFRCRIDSTGRMTFNNVTLNLGDGGDGGDATAGPCCPVATATGGDGGKSGNFRATSGDEVRILGSFNLNPGKGGKGGMATATGSNGVDGCPGDDGCDAIAIGGKGHSESKTLSARGNVSGMANLVLGPVLGGDGGDAIAIGGDGGSCTCPCCSGAAGGTATATGGKGGDATLTALGGATGGGATAGNGGTADATGGHGGNGSDCDKFNPGGDGGPGGDADATGGDGGVATGVGPLTDGAQGQADAAGGDGGNGGLGCLGGAGGFGGIAIAVGNPANESDGLDGNPGPTQCPHNYCIPPGGMVPAVGTSGPIPNGFTGTAQIIDPDTLAVVGGAQFQWQNPGLPTNLLWDATLMEVQANNTDPVRPITLTINVAAINWIIPPPTIVGSELTLTFAQAGTGFPGQQQVLDGSMTVTGFQDITPIPPTPTGVPEDFTPSFFDVFYRVEVNPAGCSVNFNNVCLIDP